MQPAPLGTCDERRLRLWECLGVFALLLGALGVRVYFFSGSLGNDDLRHAYHAYFLFQPDSVKHAEFDFPDCTVFRRMAVNLPLWLSMRIFGVHEWSLALVPLTFSLVGLLSVYGALRLLAGSYAGLLAAALWAFLPADVYMATLWLQDSVFVGCFALCVFLIALAERRVGWRRHVAALLAGAVVGYMQYAKESSFLLLGAIMLYGLALAVRRRCGNVWLIWPAAGYALTQGAMGLVFLAHNGDFLHYWRATAELLLRFRSSDATPYSLADVFLRLRERVLSPLWLMGYAAPVVPVLAIAAFATRRVPLRGLLALLALEQAYVTLMATKMTLWQERYILQLSVPVIVLSALGAHAAQLRLPPRWRGAVGAVLALTLVTMTAAALSPDRQQYDRTRTSALLQAYEYVDAMAQPEDRIFACVPPGRGDFTRRTLSQFNGFARLKGGFGDLAGARAASSGYVVLSYLERAANPDSVPENWVLVLDAPPRKRWARVYKIYPSGAAPDYVADTPFSYPRDAARLRVALAGEKTPDAGEPLSQDGTIRARVHGAVPPNWVFLRDAEAPLPAAPGALVKPGAAAVTLRMRVSASPAADIKIGLQIIRVAPDGRIAEKQFVYSQVFRVDAEERTLDFRFRDTSRAGGYFVPLIRTLPPDEYILQISHFDVLVEY